MPDDYVEVRTREDMDALLQSVHGFHDALLREARLVRRHSFVAEDGTTRHAPGDHALDLLFHSMDDFRAVELAFRGLRLFTLTDDEGELFHGGSGSVDHDPATGRARICLSLTNFRGAEVLAILADHLRYRFPPDDCGRGSGPDCCRPERDLD